MKTITFLFIVACVVGAASGAFATNVSGNVNGDWDLAGSPYFIVGNVQLLASHTLVIHPGVQVLFTGAFQFSVSGRLQAIGTPGDSILFSRAYPNDSSRGTGLKFFAGADSSLMRYCIVEWGFDPVVGAHTGGGGIQTNNCSPTFEFCTIRNNQAAQNGGGIHLQWSNSHLIGCVVEGNDCPHGGGIAVGESSPMIDHCLIRDNVGGQGGGIGYWSGGGSVINCTIVHNSAGDGAGIRCCGSNTISVINTIIAWNSNAAGVNLNDYTLASSFGYCDVFGNDRGEIVGCSRPGIGVQDHTNRNGTPSDRYFNIFRDPSFVDTSNSDYRLVVGSPCIDAGDSSLPYDPDGTIADIGAYFRTGSPRPPESFGLASPEWGHIQRIASMTFEWQVANDPDGGDLSVQYALHLATVDTELAFPAGIGTQLSVNLDSLPLGDSVQVYWWVTAHDFAPDVVVACNDVWYFDIIRDLVAGTQAFDLPRQYALHDGFPNPFNPAITIPFDLPRDSDVRLAVYDVAGRLVGRLINGWMPAGSHQAHFDGRLLPSGMYFVRMDSPNFAKTVKVMLLK